jgi:hypothetical protein
MTELSFLLSVHLLPNGFDIFDIFITYMNYYENSDYGKQSVIEAVLIFVWILMISQHFVGVGYSQCIFTFDNYV